MKIRVLSLLLLASMLPGSAFLSSSCATSQRTYEGAGLGAGLGALAGALIDTKNRWRGAVLGGLIGGAIGGTVTEISQRAAREAAAEGKPVTYRTEDGFQRVEATPVGYDASTQCTKVRNRVWQDGKLVKDEVTEVCESKKTQPGYEY
ncbi:MAG: glycine zipper 2TM domain-containing protein [Candidatus Caldarchaeum sp.]